MPIFRLKSQSFRMWFYSLPLVIRRVAMIFVAPYYKPITRKQEILWDYLSAKHNHK